ncbi:hypothetical protein SteCoe_23183 [Stentor coeruleus]|uniref:Uncharacterized protein n=1 Tax=Stentor coeruleus TaxID=5963 RepID=A0A1R2BH06_9CILI|nr:hypothetical protein SteCoe_24704 [Stentor coeruleus]OMJ77274.1 hypothetical protein SteCoe_23183 [Stentor coeruleus]
MKSLLLFSVFLMTQGRLLFGSGNKNLSAPEPLSPIRLSIEGFIVGAALDSSPEELMSCAINYENAFYSLESFAKDMKNFKAKTIKKALKGLSETLQEIPRTLTECSYKGQRDYLRMHHAVKALEFPTTAEVFDKETFALNGIDITFELKTIIDSFTKGKMFDLGFSIGSLLAKISGSGIIITA